jgi:hypothetical protein
MINDSIPLLIIINFDSKLQGSYCMPKVTQHQNIANIQIPSNSSDIPSKQLYACPKEGCNSKFSYKSWLNRHVKEVHIGKSFVCEISGCYKTFPALRYLDTHTKNTHKQNKDFSCTTCKKSFYTKVSLCEHYTGNIHKKRVEYQNKHLGVKTGQTIIDGISKKLDLNNTLLTLGATTSNMNEATQADQTQEIHEIQASIDLLSKKRKLDNTSNVNEATQADQTQESYESQDILDLSIKKRKLDNSSLTVEDVSSNYDNKNAVSSTMLAYSGFLKALAYRNIVDTKETKPNFFVDCFWDRYTENLVEKDPAFAE